MESKILDYRQQAFRLLPELRLHSIEDAIGFVKARGYVFLWPIKNVTMPNLWVAVAGDRTVANEHDDPGHITWQWKDSALGKKIWYYGKILRKKATIINLEIAPYFYALSENYGTPEDDVKIQYQEGYLSLEAKKIFDALLEYGPMDTISLRRHTQMTSKASDSSFNRAITFLQSDFKILPVGISDAGGWRYAFIYDLVHREYPGILDQARHIQRKEARKVLVRLYFCSVGGADLRDVTRLFGWNRETALEALTALIHERFLVNNTSINGPDYVLATFF